jgi:hypothetical protein
VAAECVQIPFTPPPCFTETWWSPDSWFDDRDAIFPQQDDTGWQADARRCHRSSKGPGAHAGMLIADRFPDVRVEILDFACGGSQIGPGILNGWSGPEPPSLLAPNLPSQLTALRNYARDTNRDVDAMVVNIGGNDGRFADLVVECLNLLNAFDDCADNDLLAHIETRLIPDGANPTMPDPLTPMSERYRRMNAAMVAMSHGRPDEVYLTALPNPSHDVLPAGSQQNYCDGSQTQVDFYKNASRAESQAIERILAGLNGTMQRASNRHGWIFLPQLFDAWRGHGICADGATFFRTNADGLRIQGDESIPLPHISAGLGHPNEAGFANRAQIVANVVEEHVEMLTLAPALQLTRVSRDASFDVEWSDPSPAHVAETRWQIELASPGSVQRFFSSGAGELNGFSTLSATRFSWRVARLGEFQVRVRGCRASYCGPFSNAVTVATGVPGSPLDLRRVALARGDFAVPNPIRLAWNPGPNTPASVRYELSYGRVGTSCSGRTIQSCTLLGQGGSVSTTSTTTRIGLPQAGSYRFVIRACSTAGCSASSGFIVESVPGALRASPVGTFAVRAPSRVRAGRAARVDIAWRTPGRWTELDRLDIRLRSGRRAGLVRFTQDDGVLWAVRGKRRRFGHPDSDGRLVAGPFAIDLARSSVVRFGKRSRRVVLRLAVVPRRALRGRSLGLAISGRNDRGRGQRERFAGAMRVR